MRYLSFALGLAVTIALLLIARPAHAQCQLARTINNPGPMDYDLFGGTVGISGGVVVVGAVSKDGGSYDEGAAYIINAATVGLTRTLVGPAPVIADNFGVVAISGNRVLVGASYYDVGGLSEVGIAYVFDATSGALLQTLNNPDPENGDFFGLAVAISGDLAVVSAYQIVGSIESAGVCYVFDAASGALVSTLLNPDPAFLDTFGTSVAISEGIVAVGAPLKNAGASDSGAAYVFNAASGELVAALVNPDPDASDRFGASVAISGGVVAIGAPGDVTANISAGNVYVFDAASGRLVRDLLSPSLSNYDSFGFSVAVEAGRVLVGAPGVDTSEDDSGAAYLFDAATGDVLATLDNPTPGNYDTFGSVVAMSGGVAIVGAQFDDTGASDSGSVYVYADCGSLATPSPTPTPIPSSGAVIDYLLGRGGDPFPLDLNADSATDIADVVLGYLAI